MHRVVPRGPFTEFQKVALVLEIVAAYARVRYWLLTRSMPSVVRVVRTAGVASPPPFHFDPPEAATVAVRLGKAVNRTLQVAPLDSRCLVQSLVLVRLLATRGVSASLVIGTHSQPDFRAHAWVEHDSYPLLPLRGFGNSRLVEL